MNIVIPIATRDGTICVQRDVNERTAKRYIAEYGMAAPCLSWDSVELRRVELLTVGGNCIYMTSLRSPFNTKETIKMYKDLGWELYLLSQQNEH